MNKYSRNLSITKLTAWNRTLGELLRDFEERLNRIEEENKPGKLEEYLQKNYKNVATVGGENFTGTPEEKAITLLKHYKKQIDSLAKVIQEECPEEIVEGSATEVAENIIKRYVILKGLCTLDEEELERTSRFPKEDVEDRDYLELIKSKAQKGEKAGEELRSFLMTRSLPKLPRLDRPNAQKDKMSGEECRYEIWAEDVPVKSPFLDQLSFKKNSPDYAVIDDLCRPKVSKEDLNEVYKKFIIPIAMSIKVDSEEDLLWKLYYNVLPTDSIHYQIDPCSRCENSANCRAPACQKLVDWVKFGKSETLESYEDKYKKLFGYLDPKVYKDYMFGGFYGPDPNGYGIKVWYGPKRKEE